MIGYPYAKLMNAILEVDQSASLLVTSVAAARRLGIAEDRWVCVAAIGDAHDHWFVSERVDFTSSPAIEVAGRAALEMADLAIHDRDGAPSRGIVVGRLDDGRRFLANTPDDRPTLEALLEREAVGRRSRVEAGPTHRFDPA